MWKRHIKRFYAGTQILDLSYTSALCMSLTCTEINTESELVLQFFLRGGSLFPQ